MFSGNKLKMLGSVAVCAMSLQGVYAQETQDDEGEFSLEEIIVTGEKRGKTLFDSYSSVAVISGADIEKQSLESLSDVFDQIANVSTRIGGEGFSIRGISNFSTTGAGSGPLSTIYIDGAAISGPGIRFGTLNTWDVSQIEVFRGAQSTNQGRNALAGVVIMRSKDPVYEFEGKAKLSYANYGSYTVSGALNIPISEDQVALRLGIDIRNSDGFITDTTLNTDEYNRKKSSMYRGKLLVEPAGIDGLRNIFTVSYSETRRGDDFVNDPDPFTRQTTANILGRRNLDQFIATWEADYEISDSISLYNVTSFNNAKQDRLRDDDRTAGGGDNRRVNLADIDTLSEELRLNFVGDNFNGFIGGYYLKQNSQTSSIIETGISVPNFVPAAFRDLIAPFYDDPFFLFQDITTESETRNYALFANVDFEVTDRITLHGGIRYDNERQERDSLQLNSLGSPLPDVAAAPAPFQPILASLNAALGARDGITDEIPIPSTYKAWLPQFGATVRWSDQVSTSVLAKRGYRAGGSSVTLGGIIEFDPEYVWTYEASVKTQLLDNRVTLNATVFHMDWTDQQVLIEDPILAINLPANVGESDLDGFEIELKAAVTENFEFYSSAGYTKSEFVDFPRLDGSNFAGNSFANSPKWNLVTGGTYRNDMGVFVHADVNYQSGAFGDVANTLLLDSRTLVNAKVGFEADGYGIYAFVRNLFNEEYIAQRNVTGAVKVGDPQVFGIELKANF